MDSIRGLIQELRAMFIEFLDNIKDLGVLVYEINRDFYHSCISDIKQLVRDPEVQLFVVAVVILGFIYFT